MLNLFKQAEETQRKGRSGAGETSRPEGSSPRFTGDFTEEFAPRASVTGGLVGAVEEHLVSLLAPTSFEAEQYRVLRHSVEQRHRGADLRVLAVTSAGDGEGKTTTAINLAGALAQAPDARVLLVEADLRRPSILRLLGAHPTSPGLVEAVLNPGLSLQDVVRTRQRFNLALLPAGAPPIAPYEVLKSPRLEALIAEARRVYDYVILDVPPVIPCPDYRLVEKWIDGALVVVAAHRATRKMVQSALNLMDPLKVLGLVFNADDSPTAKYHQYYYADSRLPRRGSQRHQSREP